jgi:hypothetical protein
MVPREPSDIARIGMLGAKRELLELTERVEVQAGEIVVTKYRHH